MSSTSRIPGHGQATPDRQLLAYASGIAVSFHRTVDVDRDGRDLRGRAVAVAWIVPDSRIEQLRKELEQNEKAFTPGGARLSRHKLDWRTYDSIVWHRGGFRFLTSSLAALPQVGRANLIGQ